MTRIIAALCLVLLSAAPAPACGGCGCRGGPGYRGPDGLCVTRRQLTAVCGRPPETRCRFEGPIVPRPPPRPDRPTTLVPNPFR